MRNLVPQNLKTLFKSWKLMNESWDDKKILVGKYWFNFSSDQFNNLWRRPYWHILRSPWMTFWYKSLPSNENKKPVISVTDSSSGYCHSLWLNTTKFIAEILKFQNFDLKWFNYLELFILFGEHDSDGAILQVMIH